MVQVQAGGGLLEEVVGGGVRGEALNPTGGDVGGFDGGEGAGEVPEGHRQEISL